MNPDTGDGPTAVPCSYPGCSNYATREQPCPCGESHPYCDTCSIGGA